MQFLREFVHDHETNVVTSLLVLGTGVTQANNEQFGSFHVCFLRDFAFLFAAIDILPTKKKLQSDQGSRKKEHQSRKTIIFVYLSSKNTQG